MKRPPVSIFGQALRRWRGPRKQSEAAYVLAVPLRTYQSWEGGQRQPATVCRSCVAQRMEKNPVTVQP